MRLAWMIPLLVSGPAFAQDAPPTPPATTQLLTTNCKRVATQKVIDDPVERVDLRAYDEVTISLVSRDDTVVIVGGKRGGKVVPDREIKVGGGTALGPLGYIEPHKPDRSGTFISDRFPEGGSASSTYRLRLNRCRIEVLKGGSGDDGLQESEGLYVSILLPAKKRISAR